MTYDNRKIRRIVILGGGTAGWMSASYLAKALGPSVEVTVLESPAIPRLGVGEATIPNLQKVFFDFLGVPEEEWMRECKATFKMGVRLVNWNTAGPGEAVARTRDDGSLDQFDHLFGVLPEHHSLPLSHYWSYMRLNGTTEAPFDRSCYPQPEIMDRKLSPRYLDGTPWTSYAWHFDAQLLADFLSRFATQKLHVTHIEDSLADAEIDESGRIIALNTETGRRLEGDLFIDCSGFRGLLINQALQEPFVDMSDHLLNDRAVATQVPHNDEGVDPFTAATAGSSGWIWKIPLLERFGTGYVYSSKFASQDDATLELCKMWGLDPETQSLNHLSFRVGRNRRSWVGNCVSIGTSSCFLEPLESTGIYFTYATLYQLVKYFPDRNFDPVLAEQFNRSIEEMFDDSRDFIQAHFSFVPRTDTPYWRECRGLELADQFMEKVAQFRSGLGVSLPITDENTYYSNFEVEFRNFWSNANYFCIFTGLGLLPERALPILAHRPESIASAASAFDKVQCQRSELLHTLPSHSEYLKQLYES